MKIIKYGHIVPQRTKCTRCGAEYEFTPKDTKKKVVNAELRYYVNCPVCDKPYILETGDKRAETAVKEDYD